MLREILLKSKVNNIHDIPTWASSLARRSALILRDDGTNSARNPLEGS